jgi:hypothetical protein
MAVCTWQERRGKPPYFYEAKGGGAEPLASIYEGCSPIKALFPWDTCARHRPARSLEACAEQWSNRPSGHKPPQVRGRWSWKRSYGLMRPESLKAGLPKGSQPLWAPAE